MADYLEETRKWLQLRGYLLNPLTAACKKCGGTRLTWMNGQRYCEHCGPQGA